ncbi:MAG: hypothetical protein V4555_07125, partial [Acidobacteriota bacterium]
FTGAVSLSVAGLPVGAVATFSPPQVVPGAGAVGVTMTVSTPLRAEMRPGFGGREVLWALVVPVLFVRRRRWLVGVMTLAVVGMVGCGARTVSGGAPSSRSYALTVTGTSTNLAGAVVVHLTVVTLVVE